MNQFIQLVLIVLASIVTPSFSHSAEPVQLRVLTYNIHHAEGIDRKLDLERIAKVILSVKPDLVALQEVDKNVKRTQDIDQPAELAKLTKMNVAFGANIELQGGHYGNAILSRFPIKEHQNLLLPNVDEGEQRGVLIAEIAVPHFKTPLLLLATHFDHRPDDRERLQSARAIDEFVEQNDRSALLMGDLNDVIGSQTLKTLGTAWERTNDEPIPTVPVTNPTRQIDFILYHPFNRWSVIETRRLDEAVASDHRAIFSVIEFDPGVQP